MSFEHIAMTGATGFIGSSVMRQLLAARKKVTVLLRPTSDTSRIRNIDGFDEITYPNLRDDHFLADLRSRAPDVFIHCGWRGVVGGERNEAFQITDNISNTIETVSLAAAVGCRQWIGLGSQAEYGNPNRKIDENAPLEPTSLYGKAKLAAGIAAMALADAHEMTAVWTRVFSVYGPGDGPTWFFPYVIREFLSGRGPKLTKCEQLWDYLYVEDAARAIELLADGKSSGTFNLGSGSSRPLRNYIDAIRSEVGCEVEPDYGAVPYLPDQVMHLEADVSRIASVTGWKPETVLQDGIRETVDFERQRADAPSAV